MLLVMSSCMEKVEHHAGSTHRTLVCAVCVLSSVGHRFVCSTWDSPSLKHVEPFMRVRGGSMFPLPPCPLDGAGHVKD